MQLQKLHAGHAILQPGGVGVGDEQRVGGVLHFRCRERAEVIEFGDHDLGIRDSVGGERVAQAGVGAGVLPAVVPLIICGSFVRLGQQVVAVGIVAGLGIPVHHDEIGRRRGLREHLVVPVWLVRLLGAVVVQIGVGPTVIVRRRGQHGADLDRGVDRLHQLRVLRPLPAVLGGRKIGVVVPFVPS